MKRATHVSMGAAVALPSALTLTPPAAAGAIFLGMAGAVIPDYADLRSDIRRVLRHRGVSHSILFAGAAVALLYAILNALTRVDDSRFQLDSRLVPTLLLAFGLGIGSHLLLDAATPSGIRPFLPIWGARLRVLPPGMRVSTGGPIDGLIHTVTSLIVTLGLLYLVYERLR